jgi:hypothetical protein
MMTATSRAVLLAASLLLLGSSLRAASLEEFRIFIELNDTDQDIGVQVALDGEAWRVLKILDGLSELFFEGNEPSLDELPLDEFFARFPAGVYRIVGKTVDGATIKASARFTHALPDAPVVLSPADGTPVDPTHAVIRWQPVTTPPGIVIAGYEVIVGSFDVKVPATTTSVTVPPEVLEHNKRYGFEVLSIEAGGNQTITAGSFTTQ